MTDVAARLAERIRREGPIPFDRYMETALYDERGGFFARGSGAGRAGRDFVTSPEVGSLFGALMARALDGCWNALERTDPFVVIEAGAGRGRLAADVLRARPACAAALRYLLVERSPTLRDAQRDLLNIEPTERALGPAVRSEPAEVPQPVAGLGPIVGALDELPAIPLAGVVLANELLDNLPVRIVESAGRSWSEVRVGLAEPAGGFAEVRVPAPPDLAAAADELLASTPVSDGVRIPVPSATDDWVAAGGRSLRRGFLVVIDYADTIASLIGRGRSSWLRTYRAHERGLPPLAFPGEQDITCDVLVEHLLAAARRAGFELLETYTQAEWLVGLGIDELVADARATWQERAALGDLAAMTARSHISEAAALTDPGGLGGHSVFVFGKGLPDRPRVGEKRPEIA